MTRHTMLRGAGRVVATLAAPVVVAAAFRIPAILSPRHLGYDDGVYGASVELMGAGFAPFSDFFSSQGPVFLPMLRLADMATPHSRFGVRFAMLLTGVAIAVGVYLVARRYAPRTAAAVVGALAGCSGTVLAAASSLQSDGVALAFGTLAMAALVTPGAESRWRAVGVGALLGLGLMTKSLHLLPVGLVVAAVYASRRAWPALATAVATATAVGLAVTLPWGVRAVWDDYVSFHLSRPDHTSWWENVAAIPELLLNHEPMILLVLAVAAASALAGLRSPGPMAAATPAPQWLPGLWLGATLAVLIGFSTVDAGFLRFLAFAVVPLLIVVAQLRPPVKLVVALAVVAVPLQWIDSPLTEVGQLTGPEREVVDRIDELAPGSLVVSDEPGLGWVAEAMSHPATVDVSFGRIDAGDVTTEEVAAAIADPATCVVVSWSGRLEALGIELPDGYVLAEDLGNGRWLAVRPSCPPG